jgi:hypothetical protein
MSLRPIFVGRIGLEDFRAGVRRRAAREAAIGLAGDRIEHHLIGERSLEFREPARNVLALRAAGLAEAVIGEDAGRAADPIRHAVDDLLAGFVLIESEPEEIVQRAAGLRLAAV